MKQNGKTIGLLAMTFAAILVLASSCASTKALAWMDGTYDSKHTQRDYWLAVGRSVDETHAIGSACATLEAEISALLGNKAGLPSLEVRMAEGNSGAVVSPTTGAAIFYASLYDSVSIDGQSVVRIGFRRSDMAKSLKKIHKDAYDDAAYELKNYKKAGKNPLDRMAALQKASRLSQLADRSGELLMLFTGKSFDSLTEKIASTKENIVSDLKVRIDSSAVDAPFKYAMIQAYAQQLQGLGFGVVEKKEDLVVKLSYKQLLTPKAGGAPYAYMNYTLAYSILSDSSVILSIVENERIAAVTDGDAKAKAERYATVEAPRKFAAAFMGL